MRGGRLSPRVVASDGAESSTSTNGGSVLTVTIENNPDDNVTVISISGTNKENLLLSVSTALNGLGLIVVNASITTKRDTNTILDVFMVTDAEGNALKEDIFPMLQELLMQTCLQTYKSSAPAIYGVAAAAEARWLRSAVNANSASSMAGGQGESSSVSKSRTAEAANARSEAAAALELAAAEMAQAAAILVSVERVASELAMEYDGHPDDDALESRLIAQEEARTEASAVLERRMAAMEAALASRRQLKMQLQEIADFIPTQPSREREPEFAQPPPAVGTGPGCGQGYEILLQGFNWESCHGLGGMCWYDYMKSRIDEFADAGFTSIWLPPATESVSEQGYLPLDLYNLNSKYGSEQQLVGLIKKMRERNVKSIADIVINHRCASIQKDGRWNQFGGRLAWDESVITSNNPEWGGRGNAGSGDEYFAAPNIDHSNDMVRSQLKEWMKWMREFIGYDGFRFDFVKGYSGNFTQEYVDASVPRLSIGEFWDACDYSDGVLAYNQDAHRQRTVNWCDATGGTTAAFDFTTKGILQEALGRNERWRLTDAQGRPPGVMGLWASRAVTFIDNHDTGSTLNHWPFPSEHIQEGYAYLLTHPGTPTIFFDHWSDPELGSVLAELVTIRKKLRIQARSKVKILVARAELYAAYIDDKLCMKMGPGDWSPNRHSEHDLGGDRWEVCASGKNFAVWRHGDADSS